MNWYIAKLIFQIESTEAKNQSQFDEQIRLIEAATEQEALQKSMSLGEQEQHILPDGSRNSVRWNFVHVTELFKLNQLADGAEIYYKITEPENPKRYLDSIAKKAKLIQLSLA